MDLFETRLINVGQINLARLRLIPEIFYLLSAALESNAIFLFLNCGACVYIPTRLASIPDEGIDIDRFALRIRVAL